jgi:hypothetical protein
MGSLAERRPNRRPRRSSSWQAATPGAGSSLDWLREVTSRLAVTARIDPSSTPGIKATAAPQPRLGSGIATVPQPERLDGMSNPRQEQAEIHQGLLFRSRDRPLLSIVMGRTIRLPMISERNEATQRGERFTRSDFLPALLFLHLRELAVRVLQLISRAGIWQCSTFGAPLSLQGSDGPT